MVVSAHNVDRWSEGSHVLICDTVNIASKLYISVKLTNSHPDGQAVRRQVFTHVALLTYGRNV
jgi:hypothetical protein